MSLDIPVEEVLFTVLLFTAMLAVFTRYAEVVLLVVLLVVIWQFVAFLGASWYLAVLLIMLAAFLRVAVILGAGGVTTPLVAGILDDLLSRPDSEQDQQGRAQTGPDRRKSDDTRINRR